MAQIVNRTKVNEKGKPIGEPTYQIRIPLGADETGKRHFYTETVHCSLKKATERATELQHKRDRGERIEPSHATLKEYLTEWLTIIKPRVSARTHASYKSLLDNHVIPVIGWKRIAALSPLDLEMVYSGMESDKKSRRTIQYTHTVLSAALHQAVQWKMILHNPARDTDKRTRRRGRQIKIHPFTEAELALFLKHAEADPYYVVFLVAVTSGLRPEEYLALQWKHFDEKAGTLRVERVLVKEAKGEITYPGPKTESGRRTVPIPRVTVEALKQLKREQRKQKVQPLSALILATKQGDPLDAGNLRRRHFREILKAAKLEQRRLYELRHTWVTLSLAAGADPKAVAERAGHTAVGFLLDTYHHVIPSVGQKLSDTVEALFSR